MLMNFYFNGKIVLWNKIKNFTCNNNNNNNNDNDNDDNNHNKDAHYNDANDWVADFPVVFS